MFSFLPLPLFIGVGVVVVGMLIYAAVKYRKGEHQYLFVPLCMGILCVTIATVGRCIDEWAYGTTLQHIFAVLQMINPFFICCIIIIMGILRYKAGYVDKEKKAIFFLAISIMILLLSIAAIFFGNMIWNDGWDALYTIRR